ncbi:MAG TPA: ATPase, T2SS/T4P/T4SS family, partial [Blastocatellia bacterium]
AAETGHLVLSTLHTLDATETVNRIVSVFPPHQQRAIRLQLASVLKAVVSMRLVRAAESIQGRVPAVEVMVVTPYIRDCVIHPEKTYMIREAIAQGTSQYGMQTFDQSLFDLYSRGLITCEEALNCATNADEFKLRVSGVRSVSDQAREDMERVRKRTGPLDATKPETKQFVNWLLEGTEQVTR